MLALVGTVMSRSPFGNVLLRGGDGVLGTHTVPKRLTERLGVASAEEMEQVDTALRATREL